MHIAVDLISDFRSNTTNNNNYINYLTQEFGSLDRKKCAAKCVQRLRQLLGIGEFFLYYYFVICGYASDV